MTEARDNELRRAQRAYAARDADPRVDAYWAADNPSAMALLDSRNRAVLRLLQAHGIADLRKRSVADFGCGAGSVLEWLLMLGLDQNRAFGIDLSAARIAAAQTRLPDAHLVVGSADQTGLPGASQDLVIQFTLFSSVLDSTLRQCVAREMDRVLKPGGHILWVDVLPPSKTLRALFAFKRTAWWLAKGVWLGRPFPKDVTTLQPLSLQAVAELLPEYDIDAVSACVSRDVVAVRGPVTRRIALALDHQRALHITLVALASRRP